MVPVRHERKWPKKIPVNKKPEGIFGSDSCMIRESENPDFGALLGGTNRGIKCD